MWIRIKDQTLTSAKIAENLLTEKGLAVVPGESFGMANHIRLSITMSELELNKAIEKMEEFFK